MITGSFSISAKGSALLQGCRLFYLPLRFEGNGFVIAQPNKVVTMEEEANSKLIHHINER